MSPTDIVKVHAYLSSSRMQDLQVEAEYTATEIDAFLGAGLHNDVIIMNEN